ncbi:hypothetical protein [Tsukamurella soli]|uniref:Rv0361 family membrane protein n=1 Tax=Tsukamurella soli TaxID=644556 RepID=UPI0031E6C0C8
MPKASQGRPAERGGGGLSAAPFVVALVVAVVGIGGVLLWNTVRPAKDRLNDPAQIQVTIGQYYGALNKGRYADLVANTCAKDRQAPSFPPEKGFADARKAAVDKDGDVKLDAGDVTKLTVSGDTATANLVLHYAKLGEQTQHAKFVREGGKWKMCS